MSWSIDDVRIVGDIVVGSLLARVLTLIAMKAFIEPAAIWTGKWGYRKADELSGDRLPDFFKDQSAQEPAGQAPIP
jgi:hypothetical protein